MAKRRLIASFVGPRIESDMREPWDPIRNLVKVYRDSEFDEYRVRFYRDGALVESADSFHSDKADALATTGATARGLQDSEESRESAPT